MKLTRLLAAFGLSLVTTFAQAHEPAVVVDGNFGGGRFNWERGDSFYFLYRYLPIVLEGELHLCGAFAGTGTGNHNKFHRAAMRDAEFVVNGETAISGLGYFTFLGRRYLSDQLVGQEARCMGTGIMTNSLNGLNMDIEFREGSYRVRR